MASEKRLIDAIAYCKVLREEMDYLLELDKTKGYQTLKERMGLEVAIADLGDMPTVDAKPVAHGRWVKKQFADDCTTAYRCSDCHTTWDANTNYCPNCGAKMDGEEKDSNLLFADMEENIDA